MSRLAWTDPHVHVLIAPPVLSVGLRVRAALYASRDTVSLHQKLET